MSGQTFRLHSASLRSHIGYRPPTGSRRYGDAIQVLAAKLAGDRRFCHLFQAIVRRMNPWQSPGETAAAMYEATEALLETGWHDTLNAASPDPGRHSENCHTFSLRDRLQLLAIFQLATVKLGADHQENPGWCWSFLAEREGVR